MAQAFATLTFVPDQGHEHNVRLRRRPGQKHNCVPVMSTRGEKVLCVMSFLSHTRCQVEILHNVEGEFANAGCRARLAQAVTMEGVMRFDTDHEYSMLWHEGELDSDKVPSHRLTMCGQCLTTFL